MGALSRMFIPPSVLFKTQQRIKDMHLVSAEKFLIFCRIISRLGDSQIEPLKSLLNRDLTWGDELDSTKPDTSAAGNDSSNSSRNDPIEK